MECNKPFITFILANILYCFEMKKLSYFPLGFFPTPIHKLNNLSKEFPDYNLFIKRDDQTGLAFGGNKTRKLEYLIREALEKSCDTVVTIGAAQSNHCRQTAAAAVVAGLECHLLLRGPEPDICNGNYLLDKMLGAHIHWFEADRQEESENRLLESLRKEGKKPYLIPVGGSNSTGALGYVKAMEELKLQMEDREIDHIVFASCSGGTHAGMVLGKKIFNINSEIHGVSIEKDMTGGTPLRGSIIDIANEAAVLLDVNQRVKNEDVLLIDGYNDAGYGVVTSQEVNAISVLAKSEGIFLDPVYTGRAFAGMLDLLKKGYFQKGSKIMFWHTGGAPANFHYADQILE